MRTSLDVLLVAAGGWQRFVWLHDLISDANFVWGLFSTGQHHFDLLYCIAVMFVEKFESPCEQGIDFDGLRGYYSDHSGVGIVSLSLDSPDVGKRQMLFR